MEHQSGEIPVLLKTDQELTLTKIFSYLNSKENSTPMMPVRPLGGNVYLYYNPGKEGYSHR